MKIKKLILTGFGPYALKQELSFEDNLQDKNMFVITGNTGAGKTTIFDAINFVLYGEASGKDREPKALRSDFADVKTPTEVELWFSLRGKDYYIKRSPEYYRPKQRGEGLVKNTPTAELILPNGKVTTGFKEVTNEIKGILGISSDQFKQLVMIPQGEFKRLLNAESQEKEEIFRKIFGTEVFEKIQRDIKDKSNKIESNVRQIKRDRATKIRSFKCDKNDSELLDLINSDEHNVELLINKFTEFIKKDKEYEQQDREELKKVEETIRKISDGKFIGENINKKFEIASNTKIKLDDLNNKVKEYDEKQLKLEKGKKAITVKVYEDKWSEKNKQYKRLNAESLNITEKIKIFKEEFESAKKVLINEQGKEAERNNISTQIEENKKLKNKAIEYEKQKKDLDTLESKIKVFTKKIEEINRELEINDNELKKIEKTLDDINKAKEENGDLELQQARLNAEKEKIDSLIMYIKKWMQDNKKHQTLYLEFSNIEKYYNEAKLNYETLEDILRKNQAGILASKLEQKKPCPVCGSLEHPNPAEITVADVTEEQVKSSKAIFENTTEKRSNKLNELTEVNSSIKSIVQNSIEPLVKELFSKELEENVEGIISDVKALSQTNKGLLLEVKDKMLILTSKINEEKLKINERDILENLNEKLKKDLIDNNELINLDRDRYTTAKTTLEIIVSDFKGEIKTVRQLEDEEKELDNKLNNLKKSLRNAEDNANKAKEALDREEGSYKAIEENIKVTEEELKKSIEVFREKVFSLGFEDGAEYKESKISEEEINKLEREINEFKTNLTSMKILYENQMKELEGLNKVDLAILEERLVNEENQKKHLEKEVIERFARISNNKEVIKACKEYSKAIEEYENNYKVVGKLSRVINGDNSKKISFERYVLASYFEQIIEVANFRFNKMTSGRFELFRKQGTGDMRKGQGLDLEVFDNYTGKARDVKTLSGGESFKASLAMALGLADVVQRYAGGIQLDTMFIDEGFGTLDPESLDNAIECLMELQNDGRMVGVISHVPELKERIGVRLEVSSTNNGSTAKFIV